MSKTRRHSNEVFDDSELFSDRDFDLEAFIGAMEEDSHGWRSFHARQAGKAAWQQLEELSEAKVLRDQLKDWDDWDDTE